MNGSFVLVRRLTGSDLGWFAAPRRQGKARGNQRGINLNAAVMQAIFGEVDLASGDIPVLVGRAGDAVTEMRSIRRQEKNWRLIGRKVEGRGLDRLQEGDWFVARVDSRAGGCSVLRWEVVIRDTDPEGHRTLNRDCSAFLTDGMASWSSSDPIASLVGSCLSGTDRSREWHEGREEYRRTPRATDLPSRPFAPETKTGGKRRAIDGKLRRPGILAEIMRSGLSLSTEAQANFMDVLDTISVEMRRLLSDAKLLEKVAVNHEATWGAVRGRPLGFVDGGMSNVSVLGAAPFAIRVGSYQVIPGDTSPVRERFGFEVQLVDDLFDQSPAGTYDALFDDVAKLRDAARIVCETAGVLSLCLRSPRPAVVFLHGPLVNPVSPYGLEGFPNFTGPTSIKLLPPDGVPEGGRAANFVNVYLAQLNRLASQPVVVCGVVERATSSGAGPFARRVLDLLRDQAFVDSDTHKEFLDKLGGYRVSDSLLMECVLQEGEYVKLLDVDKQGPSHKIPEAWRYEIESYPRPLLTYVKPSDDAMPVRVETLGTKDLGHELLMRLIVHMSRLLPRYSFPVGLDIVDKHAKVPDWMSRQLNTMLVAQMLRRAMESGNQQAVRMARRILSGNTRDWLFRPDFQRGV